MTQPFADALMWVPKSRALGATLTQANDLARARGHAVVTLEHLLLALLEDPDAVPVLAACRIDIDQLGQDVTDHIKAFETTDQQIPGADPTLLRILEYAVAAAQQSRRGEVTGSIVLAAIIGEGQSPAARLLHQRGLTFDDTVRALQAASRQTSESASVPAPKATPDAVHRPAVEDAATTAASPATITAPPVTVDASTAAVAPSAALPEPREARAEVVSSPADASARAPPHVPTAAPAEDDPLTTARRRIAQAKSAIALGTVNGAAVHASALPQAPVTRAAPPTSIRAIRGEAPLPQAAALAVPSPVIDRGGVGGRGQTLDVSPGRLPIDRSAADRFGPPPHLGDTSPPLPQAPPLTMPWLQQPGIPQKPAVAAPPRPPSQPRRGGVASAPPASAFPAPAPARPDLPPEHDRFASAGRMQVLPSVAFHPDRLLPAMPKRLHLMRAGSVEIRIARAALPSILRLTEADRAANGGSAAGDLDGRGSNGRGRGWPGPPAVTMAISVRLVSPTRGVLVVPLEPETRWVDNIDDATTDDHVRWRWSVTATRGGRCHLQLLKTVRPLEIDNDIDPAALERALPLQTVELQVRGGFARGVRRLAGWLIAAAAGALVESTVGGALWNAAIELRSAALEMLIRFALQ